MQQVSVDQPVPAAGEAEQYEDEFWTQADVRGRPAAALRHV